MRKMNNNKYSISTISYIIPRIILLTVLVLLISSLVLSIIGIVLFGIELIINTLLITVIIISVLQIINNLIKIKTMTEKSKQVLFFQRVEVGANP
jgi:membrane protein required for beta-lactamase induction